MSHNKYRKICIKFEREDTAIVGGIVTNTKKLKLPKVDTVYIEFFRNNKSYLRLYISEYEALIIISILTECLRTIFKRQGLSNA